MKTTFCIVLCFVAYSFSVQAQPWAKSDSQSLTWLLRGNYDSALFYAEDMAALVRGTEGEHNSKFAEALDRLAVVWFFKGQFSRSRYYLGKEMALLQDIGETGTAVYVRCLESNIIAAMRSGNYEDAYNLTKKAGNAALKVYGAESPEYANMLCTVAGVYNDRGCAENDLVYLNKAYEYFIEAGNIYSKNGNKSREALIVNKENQAIYNNNIGNSPGAEALFLEADSMASVAFGSASTAYAAMLNNLAVFYYCNGNLKLAEHYLVQAVELYRKLAAGSLQTAICTNNLGALYCQVGNYRSAIKLVAEAKEIFEKDKQVADPGYVSLLNNLGAATLSEQYYASSENKSLLQLMQCGPVLKTADSLFNANCQMPMPEGVAIKSNLSLWYKMTGDTDMSWRIISDVAAESNFSLRVISVINKMQWMGRLPMTENENAHAIPEPLAITTKLDMTDQMNDDRQIAINEKTQLASTRFLINMVVGKATNIKKALGPYHPGYASMLKSLLPLYHSIGAVQTEEALMLEYINVIDHNTLQDFTFLSESEKELYYQTRLPDWNKFIAYTLERKVKNPAITDNAYDFILQNKGLMLKSSTAMRLAIQNSNDPELLRKYDDWIALKKQISILYSTPVEMRKQDVSVLEEQANVLEKTLVERSQAFGDYRNDLKVDWKNVRDALKKDEAAIEFTNFKMNVKDGGTSMVYCALVVRPGSSHPEMIRLFEEKELLDILGTNEENNADYINSVYGTARRQDDRLYRLIWQPLEPYLEGASTIYMSPSGLLFKISFAGISNGKNILLCDRYRIQVKGSTGNTVKQNELLSLQNLSALVFGGIDYGESDPETVVWNYLSGSRDEADAVSQILKKGMSNVTYLSGTKATETYLKQNDRNFNLLHVATHGFFFPDPEESKFKEKEEVFSSATVDLRGGNMRGIGVQSFLNNENPLMRSGLVFAGANDVWSKSQTNMADDGVLTAQEVTQMDMRKNFLVVLSACETGLGDIRGSEGVYGLQRALKMAGVKFIITSLWQVPDKETVEFMEHFYTNLLQLKDVRLAFEETQQEMRQKYDPFSWAAFELYE